MGLKGYSLWAVGQLDSNVQSPTVDDPVLRDDVGLDDLLAALDVAVQVVNLKGTF
jgi:hypothetical protein